MLRETASLSMGVAETHAAGLLRYGTIVWSTHIGWLRPASVLYHFFGVFLLLMPASSNRH
jgi:hypothetical protein